MNTKTGEHIVIIHNEDTEAKDIPVDLTETNNVKIYFYPKEKKINGF